MWRHLILGCGLLVSVPAAAKQHHQTSPSTADSTLSTISSATVLPRVQQKTTKDRRQVLCLALGLYHEARSEPEAGKIAVGMVILNRERATGQSICETIWAPDQFSWTRKPASSLRPREEEAWRDVQETALNLQTQQPDPDDDITQGATLFYNAKLCHPRWNGKVTIRIGDHGFLRPNNQT